jgi:hypothetical protein
MNNITSQVILATGELCPKSELKPGMILLGADSRPQMLKGVQTRRVPAFEVIQKCGSSFLIGFDQKLCMTSWRGEKLVLNASDYAEFSGYRQSKFRLTKEVLRLPEAKLRLDSYMLGHQRPKPPFKKFSLKSAGLQKIQYLDVDSYLLSDCTVCIGDRISDRGGAL